MDGPSVPDIIFPSFFAVKDGIAAGSQVPVHIDVCQCVLEGAGVCWRVLEGWLCVCSDLCDCPSCPQGGMDWIQEEARTKTSMLYDVIDNSNGFYCNRVPAEHRSLTAIPFFLLGPFPHSGPGRGTGTASQGSPRMPLGVCQRGHQQGGLHCKYLLERVKSRRRPLWVYTV